MGNNITNNEETHAKELYREKLMARRNLPINLSEIKKEKEDAEKEQNAPSMLTDEMEQNYAEELRKKRRETKNIKEQIPAPAEEETFGLGTATKMAKKRLPIISVLMVLKDLASGKEVKWDMWMLLQLCGLVIYAIITATAALAIIAAGFALYQKTIDALPEPLKSWFGNSFLEFINQMHNF